MEKRYSKFCDGFPASSSRNSVKPFPAVNSIWRNHKTQGLYIVRYAGSHTETGEALVVYQGYDNNEPADPDDVWCRPLKMWHDKFEECAI